MIALQRIFMPSVTAVTLVSNAQPLTSHPFKSLFYAKT